MGTLIIGNLKLNCLIFGGLEVPVLKNVFFGEKN